MLEFVLDWHLIYRERRTGRTGRSERIPEEARALKSTPPGVNIFIEVRKPAK